jgi:signal transduction histidine kinase
MPLRTWAAWAAVALVAVLCAVLAVLQYTWIGEISEAERQQLQEQLQVRLNGLRRTFQDEVSAAASALEPDTALVERAGPVQAYAERYAAWRQSHKEVFRLIALAIPGKEALSFYSLDLETGNFQSSDWPPDWGSMRERLTARAAGEPPRPPDGRDPALLEVPRFAPGSGRPMEPGGRRELEWLMVELDPKYVRARLPELLDRYLEQDGKLDFDAAVVPAGAPAAAIFQTAPLDAARLERTADASVPLLGGGMSFGRRGALGPPPKGEFRRGRGAAGRGPEFATTRDRFTPPPPRPLFAGEGWLLLVRHKAGSLEALVARARRRNLAVSGGLLLLILATSAALVRFSRQAQRLAQLQMNFVAGVSHELRTPLTVIRTAAFNLRGKVAERPAQVEKYGALIQDESERLAALMEQVLLFASVEAGQAIRQREPVDVSGLIDKSLEACQPELDAAAVVVEKKIEAGLPAMMADGLALRHALQNLIENALKYGAQGTKWIGIFAVSARDRSGPAVEIRVADRGPGIPPEEQDQIFDAFVRGRRAIDDQIHGTGLGLDLVKKLIEAHGGSIRVRSVPGQLTEFVVRIPAAPAAA